LLQRVRRARTLNQALVVPYHGVPVIEIDDLEYFNKSNTLNDLKRPLF
jgi:hypothetical protein